MKYGCEVCKNNIDTWNKIYERFNSKESRILGISVNDMMYTKKMIDSYKINFEGRFNSTSDFKENFKVILTPITILMGMVGMVENIWKGTISEELIPFLDKKLNNSREGDLEVPMKFIKGFFVLLVISIIVFGLQAISYESSIFAQEQVI